jgi:ferredoxin-NADP reductase
VTRSMRWPPPSTRPEPAVDRPAGALDRETPNATLVERIDLTADIARFLVRPDDGVPPFAAGQYLAFGLRIGDAFVQRPYSTASSPDTVDDTLEFLIRRVPGGTFTPALWARPPGARLRLGRPKGLFTLVPNDTRTHLFVATGTGLAPFVSMLDRLLADATPRRAVVVHGVARAAELGYRARLEALARAGAPVTYAPTVSRRGDPANAGWRGRTGRAETAVDGLFDALCLDPGSTVAYLCGNPGMIVETERVLQEHGLPSAAIRTEHYWPLDAAVA